MHPGNLVVEGGGGVDSVDLALALPFFVGGILVFQESDKWTPINVYQFINNLIIYTHIGIMPDRTARSRQATVIAKISKRLILKTWR